MFSKNEGGPITLSSRFKLTLIVVGVWQLACLVTSQVYLYLIGPLVVATYSWFFGDIHADYGRYERLSTYVALFVITLPASVLSIAVFNKLAACNVAATRKLLIIGTWESTTILMLALSYEYGLPYAISQFGWKVFGPPTSVYSFANLTLPRIIAWLECTVPTAWLSIWSYSYLSTIQASARR